MHESKACTHVPVPEGTWVPRYFKVGGSTGYSTTYSIENCVQMQKYENSLFFFEFSISTSAYLGSTVYGDPADSAKVHQVERTFRGTKPQLFTQISIFSGSTRRKVWPTRTGLLDSETARSQARSRGKKIRPYGVKISKSLFRLWTARIVLSSFCRSRKVVWD